MVKPLRRGGAISASTALLMAVVCATGTVRGLGAGGTAPATAPADPSLDEKTQRILDLERYYAGTYSEPLKDKNRLSQLVAVVSLARVDAKPLTKALLDTLGSQDVLVAQMAWEALNARYASLDDSERTTWVLGGFDIAKRRGFPGETIAPLMDAAGTVPLASLKNLPDPVLTRVLETNDPATPEGKAAIEAAGRALAGWGDARLVQSYIAKLSGKPVMAARVATMLAMLPGAPTPNDDATATRAAFAKWSRENRVTAPTSRPTYSPKMSLLPPPQRIENPDDPKWRRELELKALNLDAVELAFCIDATGSMADSNEFVIAYVETISRMLRIMSDKVKVGTVYYRHEIDPAIMLDCCKSVPDRPKDFYTKVLPLMPDAATLIQQMRAQKPPSKSESGHKRLGAYVAGVTTAMRGLQWSPKGMKIIACTGDAKPTTNSDKAMIDAARAAKDGGFLLMFLVEGPTTAAQVSPASRAATGLEPLIYKADIGKLEQDKEKDKVTGVTAAIDRFKGSSFETMTVRVLELTLPNEYRDRVKPLMDAVLPILAAQDASERAQKLVGASGR